MFTVPQFLRWAMADRPNILDPWEKLSFSGALTCSPPHTYDFGHDPRDDPRPKRPTAAICTISDPRGESRGPNVTPAYVPVPKPGSP